MSHHYPYAEVALDVHEDPDAPDVPPTPERTAALAWEQMQSWARDGYLPIVTVHMSPTEMFDIDLEDVPAGLSSMARKCGIETSHRPIVRLSTFTPKETRNGISGTRPSA